MALLGNLGAGKMSQKAWANDTTLKCQRAIAIIKLLRKDFIKTAWNYLCLMSENVDTDDEVLSHFTQFRLNARNVTFLDQSDLEKLMEKIYTFISKGGP